MCTARRRLLGWASLGAPHWAALHRGFASVRTDRTWYGGLQPRGRDIADKPYPAGLPPVSREACWCLRNVRLCAQCASYTVGRGIPVAFQLIVYHLRIDARWHSELFWCALLQFQTQLVCHELGKSRRRQPVTNVCALMQASTCLARQARPRACQASPSCLWARSLPARLPTANTCNAGVRTTHRGAVVAGS